MTFTLRTSAMAVSLRRPANSRSLVFLLILALVLALLCSPRGVHAAPQAVVDDGEEALLLPEESEPSTSADPEPSAPSDDGGDDDEDDAPPAPPAMPFNDDDDDDSSSSPNQWPIVTPSGLVSPAEVASGEVVFEASGGPATLPPDNLTSLPSSGRTSGPLSPKGTVSPATVVEEVASAVITVAPPAPNLWGARARRRMWGRRLSPLRSAPFILKLTEGANTTAVLDAIANYNRRRGFARARWPRRWNPRRDDETIFTGASVGSDAFVPDNHPNQARQMLDRHTLPGLVGTFTSEFIDQLRTQFPDVVEYAEEDGEMVGDALQNDPPSWGLQRISQIRADYTRPYYFPDSAGDNTDVWILDTGIQTNHTDFGGRAVMRANYVNGESDEDLNGHGTHVAGIVGGTTFGVAKRTTLYGVKVLNRNRAGSFSNVVLGIQFVVANARPGRTVINMSMSGPVSKAVNDAIAAAQAAGIVVVVAAGNSNSNACNSSPASATGSLVVGAANWTDTRASFSNHGRCVQLWAPGVSILSTFVHPTLTVATAFMSGSSQAAPHVAGIAALWMADGYYSSLAPLTSATQILADLLFFGNNGALDILSLLDGGNVLAYNYAGPETA